jgi:hypothetical protein
MYLPTGNLVDGDGSIDSCESSGDRGAHPQTKASIDLQERKSILEISKSSSKLEKK